MKTDQLTWDILDEDIQIIRGTLTAITPDVEHFSRAAAAALEHALKDLELARLELSRALPAAA